MLWVAKFIFQWDSHHPLEIGIQFLFTVKQTILSSRNLPWIPKHTICISFLANHPLYWLDLLVKFSWPFQVFFKVTSVSREIFFKTSAMQLLSCWQRTEATETELQLSTLLESLIRGTLKTLAMIFVIKNIPTVAIMLSYTMYFMDLEIYFSFCALKGKFWGTLESFFFFIFVCLFSNNAKTSRLIISENDLIFLLVILTAIGCQVAHCCFRFVVLGS